MGKRKIQSPEHLKSLTPYRLSAFTIYYLRHYIKSGIPEFHKEIYDVFEDDDIKLLELIAFRGSAKSTIGSLALPLWSALFEKKKFIILCSDTFTQAKQIISNLIFELEHNKDILKDFGNLRDPKEDWTATNILLKNGVRIMSRSRGQQIRGLRHLQYRPDLIVCDDIENIEDVRTKEQRDKTEEWFFSDVLPSVDGRIIIVGNLLHQDSFISRLKGKIGSLSGGVLKEFPILDKDGNSIWQSKYSSDDIEQLKKNKYFQREYLLRPVLSEGQLVKKVYYYSQLLELQRISIGVDLAISKKQDADYTAIDICAEGVDNKMYNLKCKYGRWDFNEALAEIKSTYDDFQRLYPDLPVHLGIEDVAYQKAAIEEFYRRYMIQPTPIPQVKDKRARLETLLPYIENEQLLFKEEGQEDLIIQLQGFGIEAHDDCVDALEIATRLIIQADRPMIHWL